MGKAEATNVKEIRFNMRNSSFVCLYIIRFASGPTTMIAADVPKPLKVFILAGQSNMEGQAVVDLDGKDYNGGKGTLNFLLNDPETRAAFQHLRLADGTWVVRNDVRCRYQRENAPLLAGPLTMGFSVYGDRHHFGPELQFGHVLGNQFENQVLLIKTAWGGKSLFKDFRPPSSGGEVGPYFTKMMAEIRECPTNLKQDFPSYDGQGYELSGFVWYHGWNDGVDPKHAVPEYEQNLVNLIHDVRKELNVPSLPFVIGELTGPWVQAAVTGMHCEPRSRRPRNGRSSKIRSSSWKRTISSVNRKILQIPVMDTMNLATPKPTFWSATHWARQ